MEDYIVSARKYRPKSFDEVIGQDNVTSTLKIALQKNQVAQAYLFTGPRGVGKTTCARILGKVVNCENPKDSYLACEECVSCKSYNENSSFNIFELDAASNNSVEDIRNLIDNQVRFLPTKGKYKVFIIDEVHMLSKQAFNAFLKTLEEPPAHAIFILATTEKHKIIPTILSRCQIYDFQSMQLKNIVDQLNIISAKENIKTEEEALLTIARKADGAMRDALSIFDRVLSASEDNSILYKNVLELLNLLDSDYYFKMTDFLLQNDLSNVYILFNQILKEGFDSNFFILGLSEHFRQLLISQDTKTHFLLEVSNEHLLRYENQSSLCRKEFLLSGLDILNKCDYQFPFIQNKRLHVEIALSKICYLNNLTDFSLMNSEKKDNTKEVDVEDTVIISNESQPLKKAEIEISTDKLNDDSGNFARERTNSYPKPNSNSAFKMPTISELKAEIKEEEKNKKDKIPVDIELVKVAVVEFKQSINSQIVINVLNELDYGIIDNDLKIFVPSNLAKDILGEEQILLKNIREIHHDTEIQIEIIVDLDKFPDHQEIKPKKILSNREKYEIIVEQNPEVIDLIKSLDLLIDL